MKIRYSGPFSYSVAAAAHIPPGNCMLDIISYPNGVSGVMITEDKHNRGLSVTSACDRIANQAYKAYLSDTSADKTVWLGHCPGNRSHDAYIDLLQFRRGTEPLFSGPQWKRFFEGPLPSPQDFMKTYSFVLKELCTASMVFAVVDKKSYYWRVWANTTGFFIISSNPQAVLSKEMLDVEGVAASLNDNRRLIGVTEIVKQFTHSLMKGFLNGRL